MKESPSPCGGRYFFLESLLYIFVYSFSISSFQYCLCNACLKLVNYAFFFWLPLYLTDAYHWSEAQADQLSIWYDVGGIIGSVLGGYVTDRMGCRAPMIVAMLACSIGSLILYADIGRVLLVHFISFFR